MELEGSMPCSRGLRPEQHKSSLHPPILYSKIHSSTSIIACFFQVVSFILMFRPEPCIHFSFAPYLLQAPPSHPRFHQYLVEYANSESPQHAVSAVAATFTHADPYILLSRTPFRNTTNLCSSLNVTVKASCPYTSTLLCICNAYL